jgi:hypothetical protein
MKIEKGEDSAFILEAADWLMPFGGPVKFKQFDESPGSCSPKRNFGFLDIIFIF